MAPDAWSCIQKLFNDAADLAPQERAAFLERACKGDQELRRQVEELLAADNTDRSVLQVAIERAVDLLPHARDETSQIAGTRLGRYTISSLIGKGGMGAVYRAFREDDFRMQVAVKLLKRGMDTDDALARFRRERQILADLQHPNIARLLDGGATDDGLPYLVMEYVDGVPLLEHTARIPVRGRLELFRTICGAVQYAHERQIVHRDIKPANILVAASGAPKLLDFGIAKILDSTPRERTSAPTAVGTRLMTPEYASPEQVRGEPVTVATDVYSLGLVLYELLTGQRAQRIDTHSPSAIEREICTREPGKPSELARDLDPDLDMIVLKALRKEPERRYSSAEDLSADIERYLQELPVHARPESRLYRARKFVSRNRVVALAAVLSPLLLLALISGWDRLSGPQENEHSIAVLPLDNLSGDRDQEYFADGITDALISNLARIQDVRVISRTSSMTFKRVTRKLPDVARNLGVRTVAEGSVLRSGSRVRLAIRLVDASLDRPVWSGSYEGEISDVLALQEEVAAAIAAEIGAKLTDGNKHRAARHRRVDVGAYDAYLRARQQYVTAFNRELVDKAIALFERALALDRTYAPAYAGLADCYYMLSGMHYPPTEMMPRVRWAALKAIELDDSLGEAHATLALVKSLYEYDRPGAEQDFQRAIELKPGDALARLWYSLHLATVGQFDKSIAEAKHATRLDPVSPAINAYAGWPVYFARRYDQAIQSLLPLTDAHPGFNLAYALLGEAHVQKGDFPRGLPYLEKAHQLDTMPETFAQLGHAYAKAGRTADARKTLDELERLATQRYVSAYSFALVHTGLGEHDEAFRWLGKVDEDRGEWFAFAGVDPRLDAIRSDPRFASVLRRVRLSR
jgi:serine/threonine-protein kinase